MATKLVGTLGSFGSNGEQNLGMENSSLRTKMIFHGFSPREKVWNSKGIGVFKLDLRGSMDNMEARSARAPQPHSMYAYGLAKTTFY